MATIISKEEKIIEALANFAHSQWSSWMKYLFEKSIDNVDGTVTIPKWAVDRWKKQMNTKYKDLSEVEKESDREEARGMLKVIGGDKEWRL